MRDALKNYLTLASGLTEVGRQRAVAASKALVAQGEATAEQVGSLAEDLIQTSKNNRDLVTALVRSEVEKAMNVLGLATADSVERLTKRLHSLESTLREASAPVTKVVRSAARKPAAKKPAAKKAAKATTAPATKPAAKKAPARKPAAKKAAAKKPATPKTAATKPAAKKPAAKKSAAKKTTARSRS